ncbi:F-box and leucine-rich protein 22 [Anolis carolinensis]|uniref:F-box and leucine-rich protein 22 n=1 Tax=Anolis carolinensis TaxID=28377 RepID=UPI002F2B3577
MLLLTQLDGESLLHLFSFLDPESRWRLGLTCRRLRGVFLEPSLWPLLRFRSPAELLRGHFLLGPALRRLSVCWHSARVSRVCNVEEWAQSPLQRDICAKHRHAVSRLLRRASQRCPNLQCLTLSGCGHVTDGDVALVLQGCPGLQSLRLENCVRITDWTLEAALGAPALRWLQVDFCRNVTQAGLQRLRRERPSLALQAERSADMIPDEAPPCRVSGRTFRKLPWH